MERETVNDIRRIAETCGLTFSTYSPGDGATRYRFFEMDDAGGTDYFGGSHPLGTTLGVKESMIWLRGYNACQMLMRYGTSALGWQTLGQNIDVEA